MNTQTATICDVLDTDEPEEKTEFTFDELDDRAKDRVRMWFSDRLGDYEWWDCCEADFKQTAKEQGFDVDKTYWSGFSCQGDGASFDGSFRVEGKEAEDLLNGTDLRRWTLIKADAALEHGIVLVLGVGATIKDSFARDIDIFTDLDIPDELVDVFDKFTWEAEVSDTVSELAHDISHDYYKSLREEYEYQTSDEAISEACEANEWKFDEDGNAVPRL
jgi:hypothetical protein